MVTSTAPATKPRHLVVTTIAVVVAYVALAIVHTWPLVLHLDSHLPGRDLGDNTTYLWNLWWMREALASSSVSFFRTDALFAPVGASLVLHTHTALNAFLGATLLGSVSVVQAQNLLLLASLVLNGSRAPSPPDDRRTASPALREFVANVLPLRERDRDQQRVLYEVEPCRGLVR